MNDCQECDRLDRALVETLERVEKAEAERDLVLAKTTALQKNLLTPEELLDLLKDARQINTDHSHGVPN